MTEKHALILGEALIDVVIPLSGETREIPGGSPANVALTLGRLGRAVELVAWLGDDSRGRLVADHVRASNVYLSDVCLRAERTSTAQATLDVSGAASYEFDLAWELPETPVDESVLVAHSGSIATTLEPGGTQVLKTLRRAREFATVTYDPNARPTIMGDPEVAYERVLELVDTADVVKVSDEDIDWFTAGVPYPQVAREWLERGVSLVIVTRGGHGSVAYAKAGYWDFPAKEVTVVDTVGAGDSFMGAVIDALWTLNLLGAENRERLEAITAEQVQFVMECARSVSAVTVSRAGANPPWAHEL
ncbi:kinase, PfkB family [Gleimia coleocanis DSM 15436]|uniref:Kinase, PfkB family n=1 Tax=Gleimia coleocanis DSM 15436 TaxID=525245 RepID=C0VZN2_9ACTO|nr:carbohydrate kinase [Gleimia coleocanis]EEH64151.1 kinase, PfkB family [Gleimia coleocanis DSM 15436]